MAADFPDSPSIDDEFSIGLKTWKWDGTAWRLLGGGGSLAIDDLTDATITSAHDGEFLQFNGTEWVNGVSASNEPMGHEDRTESTISFNESTRTFSIAPVGESFTIWCAGKRFVKTTTENLAIPDVSGLYYIYYDTLGVLAYRTSYFVWDTDVPTSYIYWNATDDKAYFFADERHGITLDWATHEYLHRTRGAAIADGFGASSYTIDGDGSSDAHAKIDIANGTFFDEDLQVDIVHSATPTANTWEQVLQGAAEIPVFYKSGSAWVKDAATTFPLKQGSSRPAYNLNTAGTWSTPDVANNHFGVSWIIATNNLNEPIIAVLGQNSYTNNGSAQAEFYESLDLDGFPIVEFRPLYKIIYECKTSYSNTPSAAFVEVTDLRSIISGGFGIPTVPVSDHGSLTGLADDDHPQYLDTVRHDVLDHSTAMSTVVLNDLGDINVTSAASGDTLSYTGTGWVSAPGMPSGSITQFAGSSAPSGWLSCDGTAVSRTTYAALFAVIGTTYGAGDGSTTFALPNMKGRIPVGYDSAQTEFDALGELGGAKTHTLTTAEMPSHTHTQNSHNHTQDAHGHSINDPSHSHGMQPMGANPSDNTGTNGYVLTGASLDTQGGFRSIYANFTGVTVNGNTATNQATTATNQNTGGGNAHNNLQPYIVLNYIIKA